MRQQAPCPEPVAAPSPFGDVLYLHRTQYRGVERVHIDGIVEAFRAAGRRVTVVGPGAVDDDEPPHSRAAPPASLLGWLSRHLPEIVFEMGELAYNVLSVARMRRHRADLVYERYAIFAVAGALYARRRRVPLVLEVNYTARSPLVRRRSRLLRPVAVAVDRWLFRRADVLAAVSTALKDELVQTYGVSPDRVVVVPNAADPDVFDPDGVAVTEVNGTSLAERTVVGFVGGFYPWHGLDLLLSAFNQIERTYPRATLLLVGDGPERPRMAARAAELGLRDRVLFAGAVAHQDLAPVVRAFAIGVMPDSNAYGSPMKVFEYMALARPVVAPDLSPLRDGIEPGVEGLLFPPRDVDGLARCLGTLLADPTRRSAMGRAGRRRVEEDRNWTHNAQLVLAPLHDDNTPPSGS